MEGDISRRGTEAPPAGLDFTHLLAFESICLTCDPTTTCSSSLCSSDYGGKKDESRIPVTAKAEKSKFFNI